METSLRNIIGENCFSLYVWKDIALRLNSQQVVVEPVYSDVQVVGPVEEVQLSHKQLELVSLFIGWNCGQIWVKL